FGAVPGLPALAPAGLRLAEGRRVHLGAAVGAKEQAGEVVRGRAGGPGSLRHPLQLGPYHAPRLEAYQWVEQRLGRPVGRVVGPRLLVVVESGTDLAPRVVVELAAPLLVVGVPADVGRVAQHAHDVPPLEPASVAVAVAESV